VSDFSLEETAARAGVPVESVSRFARLGLVDTGESGRFSAADVRKVEVVQFLERAGLPLDGLAVLIQSGALSLDFIEAAGYDVFAP